MNEESDFEIEDIKEVVYSNEIIIRDSELRIGKKSNSITQLFVIDYVVPDNKDLQSIVMKEKCYMDEFMQSLPHYSTISNLGEYKIIENSSHFLRYELYYTNSGSRFQNLLKIPKKEQIPLKLSKDFLDTYYNLFNYYENVPVLTENNLFVKKDGSLSLIYFPFIDGNEFSLLLKPSDYSRFLDKCLTPPELRKIGEKHFYMCEENISYTWGILIAFCLLLLDPIEDINLILEEDVKKIRESMNNKENYKTVFEKNRRLLDLVTCCLEKEIILRLSLRELSYFYSTLESNSFDNEFNICKQNKKYIKDMLKYKNLLDKESLLSEEESMENYLNPEISKSINNFEKRMLEKNSESRFQKRNHLLFEEFNNLYKSIMKIESNQNVQVDNKENQVNDNFNTFNLDPFTSVQIIIKSFKKKIEEKNNYCMRYQREIMMVLNRMKKVLFEKQKSIGADKKQVDITFYSELLRDIENVNLNNDFANNLPQENLQNQDNPHIANPIKTYKKLEQSFNNFEIKEYKKYFMNPFYLDLQDLELNEEVITKIATAFNQNDSLVTVIICNYDDYNKKLTGKTTKLTGDMLQKISRGLQNSVHLRSIIIQNNLLENKGAKLIAEIIKDKNEFQFLNLINNQIKESGAIELFVSIEKLGDFNSLLIGRNPIDLGNSPECLNLLIKAFQSKPIKMLDISFLNAGKASLLTLLNSMKELNTLEHINLEGNQISDSGEELIILLANEFPALTHIYLGSNNFSQKIMSSLSKLVGLKKHLKQFRISYNALHFKGLLDILKSFYHPPQIQEIDISNNEFEENEEFAEAITDQLSLFFNLQQINLTKIIYNQKALSKAIDKFKKAGMNCRILIYSTSNQ